MHADRPRERGPGPGWRGGDSPHTGPGNFLDARTQAKVQISGAPVFRLISAGRSAMRVLRDEVLVQIVRGRGVYITPR